MGQGLLSVSRVERKYPMSRLEAVRMEKRLRLLLPEDENSKGSDGYRVRSLYFDSFDNTDYFEKEDGCCYRKKIRLRIYSPEDTFAKLEMKEKYGENQRKRSLSIGKQDALRMIQGDYSCLLKQEEPFAKSIYELMESGLYRPKCLIEYRRKAFTGPANDTRITLDWDIRGSESDFRLFSESLNLLPVCPPDSVTMEVKYNGFLLSYIRELVSSCEREQLSKSKYVMGRSISYCHIDNFI